MRYLSREAGDFDEVAREYVEDTCRSCVEPARLLKVTYRSGRVTLSKCGRCYF